MSAVVAGQRLAPGQKVETFRYWRLCAWAGPVFLFVFVVFWGFLGGNISYAQIRFEPSSSGDPDRTEIAYKDDLASLDNPPDPRYRTTPEMQHDLRCGRVMRFLR